MSKKSRVQTSPFYFGAATLTGAGTVLWSSSRSLEPLGESLEDSSEEASEELSEESSLDTDPLDGGTTAFGASS